MDWAWLVDFKVPAWELILRGSAIYWFLFLIFRLVLRRDVGAVGVADVLLVVLVADASQNAMTGGYTSVAEGAVLVATLIGWNLLLDWMAYRFPWAYRLVEPPPLLLIRGGRVQHKNLRSEMITLAELRGASAPARRRVVRRGQGGLVRERRPVQRHQAQRRERRDRTKRPTYR